MYRAIAEAQEHVDSRVTPREIGHYRHGPRRAVVERGGDAERAVRGVELLSEVGERIRRLAQDDLAPRMERAACLRGVHTSGRPYEKRGVDLFFEPRDLLADNGLRDAEPLGCAREGASVDDRGEIGE